ncbi:MAG: L,D-transpeptidase family protein [Alphaproteobacteria bacterium]|nr:L,D-transpeptidase family protein [Alphaproteobacteria bacterium]
MNIIVTPDGFLSWPEERLCCAIGRGGINLDKREGDGVTPVGCFPLRQVLFRLDRIPAPLTCLPMRALEPPDGWCDDVRDPAYNRAVTLPYPARCESLWRDDGLYDVIVVLGHNDDPVVPGAGSAIFLHVARPDYGPTEGCVALAMPDLLRLIAICDATARLCISDHP